MANLVEIAEMLSQLTVLEAAELSKLLEEKWGVSAAAPAQIAPVTQTGPVEAVEEQTEFTVILSAVTDPAKKINVIKEVRAITGLGLKESKDLVDNAPKTLRETVSKVDAEAIKAKVEAVGGVILLQ
jgi:large subunit ribosomal protein L7/L12